MAVEVDLLADRYELGRMLGQGGMAQVFEGQDRVLDRRVAIKILHPRFAHDGEFLARFRREARAAAGLAHPGIVAVYDTGEDGDRQFIVMEFVAGRTLADVLSAEGALAPDRAAHIISAVCSALAVAHGHGLVHRDVKPGNTMITPDGTVKVMDFGIARAVENATVITTTAGIIGTPRYMSPEQVDARPLDARSDIYALGVCLYECLTGVVPFDGTSAITIAARHLNEQPRPLREVNPAVPASFEALTLKALAKDPADRHQNAEEFCAELDAINSGQAATLPPRIIDTTVRTGAAAAAPVVREEVRRPNRLRQLAALLAVAVVFGLAAYALLRSGVAGPPADAGVETAGEEVAVPAVFGQPESEAVALLRDAGLEVAGVESQPSDDVEAGLALGTDPAAQTLLARGGSVTLLLSGGQSTGGAAPAPAPGDQAPAPAAPTATPPAEPSPGGTETPPDPSPAPSPPPDDPTPTATPEPTPTATATTAPPSPPPSPGSGG